MSRTATRTRSQTALAKLLAFWDDNGGSALADHGIEFELVDDQPHQRYCNALYKDRYRHWEPRGPRRADVGTYSVRQLATSGWQCRCLEPGELVDHAVALRPAFELYELSRTLGRLARPSKSATADVKNRQAATKLVARIKAATPQLSGDMLAAYESVRRAVLERADEVCAKWDADRRANRDDRRIRELVARELGLNTDLARDETKVVVGLSYGYASKALGAAIAAWGVGNTLATDSHHDGVVLRVPVWVLGWLTRKADGGQLEIVVEDDETLIECAASLWDPHGSGPLVSLWNAFEAAKNLTGDAP